MFINKGLKIVELQTELFQLHGKEERLGTRKLDFNFYQLYFLLSFIEVKVSTFEVMKPLLQLR
jgi:hypothetical protein